SQKKVTQKAPCAPSNALRSAALSLTLAATTSAPCCASGLALSLAGSRVTARAAKPPLGSARIARTSPPPCAPVAPTTAIVFLLMDLPLGSFEVCSDRSGGPGGAAIHAS